MNKRLVKLSATFALAAGVLTGCDFFNINLAPPPVSPGQRSYSVDSRTDLCFTETPSMTTGGWQVTSLANVPCTEDVTKLLATGKSQFNQNKIGYDIDPRTGLCFANAASTTDAGWQVVSSTAVPCTDKVKQLIPAPKH